MIRLLVLFIALLGLSATAAAQSHSVLLIHSYHSGMPWTDSQHQGFINALANNGIPVDLHIEYLDSLRYREQKDLMRQDLLQTLESKFKRNPPEVIAVTDNNALDFVLDVRPLLAPDVPVVFCGINGLSPNIRDRYKNLTGVAEEAAFKETLEIIDKLLPGRRVLVLGEQSPTFRGNFASLQKDNEQRSRPSELELFDDPVLSHIEERVRLAGSDTVVFILNRPTNDDGETIDSSTAVRAISDASRQPVFSVWDYMFGDGIVGGKLTSGEAHGEVAAQQVIRILNGEAADSIPIEWESANRYLFDYEQLQRFDLQDKSLPEGSVVINRPVNFYELYRDKVVAVAVVFTLLLFFGIGMLLLNRSLTESRNLLDDIVDNLPVMVFLKRASDLSFIRFNRTGQELLGLSREELLGRHDYDFFPKEQADFFISKDRDVLTQTGVVDIPEEPVETVNGTRILHTRKLALRNKEGLPVYLLGISEDITERKQTEHQVTLLSFALNSVHEAAFLIDERARFHFVNEEACRILGYSHDELLASGVEDIDPDWPAVRWPEHWRDLQEKRSITFEGRHRAKDGRIIPVEISANFIEYVEQSYNLALVRDISERKLAEQTLVARERDYRTLIENLPDCITRFAPDCRHLFVNPSVEKTFGIPRKTFIGKSPTQIGKPGDDAINYELEQSILQVFATAQTQKLQMQWQTVDGPRTFEVLYAPEHDEEDKVVSVLGIAHDITYQKQAEETLRRHKDELEELVQQRTDELRLARDAAEAANKAKSTFLANMSHELRTPLNAILGFSQLMRKDQSLNSSQRENLEIINKSGDHLLKLINDVLEISKIEAGKQQLEISTFDLHELVREVSDMMRLKAQQKGLQLELDQSSAFPRYIKGDEARLRQILVNLVSNAVKFTKQGSVTMRLRSKHNAHHHLLIEVEDNGPGISKKDQRRLFKPFEQLSAGTSSQEGTGLGLAIVRQFVQLMGGSVSVESKPGQGSLFRVDLPLNEPDEAEMIRLSAETHGAVAGLAPGQATRRILIAEDQRDSQILLARVMTDLGLDVKVAQNGEECIQIFQQWRPDLILMDRRMPVMDGDEATRRIRELPGGDQVKVVAVTASALKEEEETLRASGMDDYVSKPYRFDEIYHILEKQLGLTLVYAEEESDHEAALVAPPSDQLRELYQLADIGQVFEIQELASRLQAENEVYISFARKLNKLAKGFDLEGISTFIKQYLK